MRKLLFIIPLILLFASCETREDINKNKNKLKNKFDDVYIAVKGKSKALLSKFRVNLKDKNHVKNRDIAKKMQKLLRIVEIPFKLIINIYKNI